MSVYVVPETGIDEAHGYYRYLRADKVRELIEYYEEALYGDLSGGDLIANGKEREKLKIELFPEGLNLERIKEDNND